MILNKGSNNFLANILVCPICKSELNFSEEYIQCATCNIKFKQRSCSFYDLIPSSYLQKEENNWNERQEDMENWYLDLINDPLTANEVFVNDYTPYSSILSNLSGLLLDLGGGNGIIRHYLSPQVDYITLEPSEAWLNSNWIKLVDQFPCLENIPNFVKGVGEYLPFKNISFDVVTSFWSLNHVNEPEKVFTEVARVLKPAGYFLVVLEDMQPTCLDLIKRGYLKGNRRATVKNLVQKLLVLFFNRKWPVQTDHIYIREIDIENWSKKHFRTVQREWLGNYLTYKLQKI